MNICNRLVDLATKLAIRAHVVNAIVIESLITSSSMSPSPKVLPFLVFYSFFILLVILRGVLGLV